MALFKLGKKKRDDSMELPDLGMPEPSMEQQSPVEQVLMMKQQGYTNNQIVQMLQSQGYDTNQINNAVGQAGVNRDFQPQQETGMPEYGQPYEQQYAPQPQNYQAPREIQPTSFGEERIQEVAEAVIDEKWEEFAGDIKKVIEWKDKTEDRIAKIEQQIIDMRLSMDTLTKSIMGKITSYDQNIIDVGTEVKAMEKVFQKVLPNLTESVNKLDRMTKSYKDPQKK